MAYQNNLSSLTLLLLLVAFILANNVNGDGLKLGLYEKTCPKLEAVVQKITAEKISLAPSLAAPLLRMHFHDCFVRGCDGSVLIDSTKNNQAEKAGFPNLSLRGFQIIDDVKAAVEDACPGVVSCADILALVARDTIYQIKGPYWPVPLGRRDGRVSIASERGHTIGTSHCSTIAIRLYNFTGKGDTDPSLDSDYVPYLKSLCKTKSNRTTPIGAYP
ncbi:hypothetical protein R6Q57_029666 [Mikania cordata]